jgi:CubicO group peptidase (beta-lactamase class C family)
MPTLLSFVKAAARLRWIYRATGLAAVVTTAEPPPPQSARATPEEIGQAVDSIAARVVATGLAPGLGVAIAMDGRTIFARAYGWADATNRIRADDRTLWYVASTSKSYTGFGVSLLAAEGGVDLVAPIGKLLPGVVWPAGADPERLTLADFLSHTHRLDDNAVVMSAAFTGAIEESRWPSLIRFARPRGDTDLVYSNFGYNVAAMVIDRKRPEGWRRFLDSAVYRPAGMTETYARLSGLDPRRIAKPHGFGADRSFVTRAFDKTDATMNSAGGHVATLHDLARWTIVQMDEGKIDGKQVFPVAAIRLSHRLIARHTVAGSKRFGYFDREGWGAGWDLGSYHGEPMVSRFGGYSSFRSHLSMLPRRRIGVVAQVNGPGAGGATDLIAALVYDLEAGRVNARAAATARLDSLLALQPAARARAAAADSLRRTRQRPLTRPIADFAGSYGHEAFGTVTFMTRGEVLRYRWGVLEGPTEVSDAGLHQIRIEIAGMGNTVAFRFDGPGAARSLALMGQTFARR